MIMHILFHFYPTKLLREYTFPIKRGKNSECKDLVSRIRVCKKLS